MLRFLPRQSYANPGTKITLCLAKTRGSAVFSLEKHNATGVFTPVPFRCNETGFAVGCLQPSKPSRRARGKIKTRPVTSHYRPGFAGCDLRRPRVAAQRYRFTRATLALLLLSADETGIRGRTCEAAAASAPINSQRACFPSSQDQPFLASR